ncbi:MAG: SDR family oxidoreductase [Chloroflexi bacterium]|nr:SDR family oxidoreductase [Chloroflexota bacterium]
MEGHPFSLAGRRAIVTGASHGIGEGIALALAGAGADVALLSRGIDDLRRVQTRVEALGRRAHVVPLDLSRLDEIAPAFEKSIDHLGGLDIVANVAGNQRRRSILDVTLDDWNFVLDVQLRGAFFVGQEAGRYMSAHGGGKIIHIASMTSYRGFSDIALYGIAKTGVVGMTRYMAVEWARYDIQVNAIAPGWIETPMTATMVPSRRRWVEEHVPRGSFGTPADIGHLAVYLASPASDYITGQTFAVDGGFLAGNPWPTLTS